MRLSALLAGVPGAHVAGHPDLPVAEVRDDSRLVTRGALFVAVPGTAADGRQFVPDAVARGAVALVLEGERPPATLASFPGALVMVPDARQALGIIAANRYGAARALALMAITGTNGKTTTAYIVEAMLRAAGVSAGLFGTVSYRAPGLAPTPAPLTTPGALMLHRLLAEMRAAGATDVVLEATSHALSQGRLAGCRFQVAALTNVTQDHLDYHGTMDQYFDAKAILFEQLLDPARGVAVTFADEDAGRRMWQRASGAARRIAIARAPGAAARGADIVIEAHTLAANGTHARFATPVGPIEIASPLVGRFNLSNIALAVGIGVARGLPAEAMRAGAGAVSVPGRLQRVANDRGVLCLVDYAHTPDALARAIEAVRPLVSRPDGRLIVVFGCGGDRDRGKRPLMGEIAAREADLAVVTSDNPRTEDPASIVEMVAEGVRRTRIPERTADDLRGARRGFHVEVDRRAALRLAVSAALPGDVVLIAGKGHEDYQIIGTTKTHFDDREEAAAAFATGATA
jgi:UDP-N-acetylmuramoyl-L-alanyl-D-glutamate--2,6-diaminopimelate ligase